MKQSTFSKALATATAAVTTLALGATSAGAAQLGPAQFAGAAKAQTLQLSLTAPSELLGLLGSADQILDLGVSLTEVASSSTTTDLSAATHLLTGMLPSGATSAEDGDSYSYGVVPAQQIGPVALGVGNIAYNIDRATSAVTANSELASLTVSLESILSGAVTPANDVLGQVDSVVDTVLTEADALVGGIVGEINAVVDELETTLEDTAGLIVDIPDVTLADLNVVSDVRDTNILNVRKLWSATSVAPVGNTVRSTADAGIVGLSILDGIVEIPEWTFSAWAETAGTPGSAQWGGNTESLALNVLGNEVISLDGAILTVGGVELDLNDPSLAPIVGEDIAAELDALVGDLLDLTGLDIEQGRLTGEAAPDGSFATASASAFTLSLAPLHAATAITELAGLADTVNSLGLGSADELFRLQLDLLPVTATATAAPAAAPVSTPETPNLPRTGGGAAAMAFGLLGMGSAGLLRRRF